ncbi:MAG: hypothetical protein N2515_08985, partial [Deltaproteobacteria bacterium]|nr:hypothetical protein [Deltaproteobacteria bacterium]
MKRFRSQVRLFVGFALLNGSFGCGGSSGPAAGGTVTGAVGGSTGGEGEAVANAPISQEAQNRWGEAIALFNSAQADGLNADECTRILSAFERANASQGGRFGQAIYMLG